jgi:predicted RNA-binding Zn ribbon-like protein
MNPTTVIALANLQRRRRSDTASRAPLVDAPQVLRTLARLAEAVSELGDCLALRRLPPSEAVEVINELASGCSGTTHLSVRGLAVRSDVDWRDPDPIAGLARRIIQELDGVDLSRFRQCQRAECDLLFFDPTRSRSRRWHAENPCGWLERQHRRREHD